MEVEMDGETGEEEGGCGKRRVVDSRGFFVLGFL